MGAAPFESGAWESMMVARTVELIHKGNLTSEQIHLRTGVSMSYVRRLAKKEGVCLPKQASAA